MEYAPRSEPAADTAAPLGEQSPDGLRGVTTRTQKGRATLPAARPASLLVVGVCATPHRHFPGSSCQDPWTTVVTTVGVVSAEFVTASMTAWL